MESHALGYRAVLRLLRGSPEVTGVALGHRNYIAFIGGLSACVLGARWSVSGVSVIRTNQVVSSSSMKSGRRLSSVASPPEGPGTGLGNSKPFPLFHPRFLRSLDLLALNPSGITGATCDPGPSHAYLPPGNTGSACPPTRSRVTSDCKKVTHHSPDRARYTLGSQLLQSGGLGDLLLLNRFLFRLLRQSFRFALHSGLFLSCSACLFFFLGNLLLHLLFLGLKASEFGTYFVEVLGHYEGLLQTRTIMIALIHQSSPALFGNCQSLFSFL